MHRASRASLRGLRVFILVMLGASAIVGALGCDPNTTTIWVCLNPHTGKLDPTIYDANHYVGGTFDPCHCYDPCGPLLTCSVVIDAGPPAPGCDAGDGGP